MLAWQNIRTNSSTMEQPLNFKNFVHKKKETVQDPTYVDFLKMVMTQ